jgi:hypothetical protein
MAKSKIIDDASSVKPKKGRRTKKEIEMDKLKQQEESNLKTQVILLDESNNISLNIINNDIDVESESENDNNIFSPPEENENLVIKSGARKRGRKPKGGKIVQITAPLSIEPEPKPNVILHLKCKSSDLLSNGYHDSNFSTSNIESFDFNKNEISYEIISNNAFHQKIEEDCVLYTGNSEKSLSATGDIKDIWNKLKILKQNLHVNNITDKKSACFWCSHDFDNPPIYIPKHYIKDTYNVYGCFCTPECAVAHLMEENIDSSIKFERYHLINHIYSKIYDYKKNIKPAPNPHYMLDKFYGNLNIHEYRALLNSERLFLIVDKPLTRILPEFHEDNEDFIINHKIIPSNNYQLKKKTPVQEKKIQTKNNIMSEKFGFNTSSIDK